MGISKLLALLTRVLHTMPSAFVRERMPTPRKIHATVRAERR